MNLEISGLGTTTHGAISNAGTLIIGSTTSDSADNAAINAAGEAVASSTTISYGVVFSGNSATADGGNGGAINNTGTLTISGAEFSKNTAGDSGGAIYNSGAMTITGTTFSDNYTTTTNGCGGAIANYMKGAETVIISANFSGNRTDLNGGWGGAIYNEGNITSISGTFTNNSAFEKGGAIYNSGTINSLSGTFTNNQVWTTDGGIASGGAIYNAANAEITIIGGTSFTGNKAFSTQSNAIYNAGTLNLDGAAGIASNKSDTIVFNDAITGDGNGEIFVKSGNVEFNNSVSGNTVYLQGGTLSIGANGGDTCSFDGANLEASAGTLKLSSGVLTSASSGFVLDAGTLEFSGTAKLAIDLSAIAAIIDLSGASVDNPQTLDLIAATTIKFDGIEQTGSIDFSQYFDSVNSELCGVSVDDLSWTIESDDAVTERQVLRLTIVPEPSMFGVIAGTLALLLAGTRRRRK